MFCGGKCLEIIHANLNLYVINWSVSLFSSFIMRFQGVVNLITLFKFNSDALKLISRIFY